MKVFLLFVFVLANFSSFADVSVDNTNPTCDSDILNTNNGTANLEIDWQPNVIPLHWYNGDIEITPTNSAATSCTYDGALSTPANPPEREGYSFDGWKIKRIFVPEGYTKLQYIESTGTQQIDTGVYSDGVGLKSELKVQLTTSDTSERVIMGIKQICTFYEIYFYNSIVGAFHVSGQNTRVNINRTTEAPYTIITDMTPSGITLSVNNIQSSYSGTMTHFSSTNYEISLFGLCNRYSISAKLYYAKMWQNGTIVRDFIPAKRDSDNVIGMWDMVSKTFFTNSGTGSFVAGPVAQ